MATLTADVTAEATSWNVSALPNVNYLQVDDEIVHVLDQKRTQNRLRVARGYAGTTAATHSSGATLTPMYVPSEGGGEATEAFEVLHGEDVVAAVTPSDTDPEGSGSGQVSMRANNPADTTYGQLLVQTGGLNLLADDGNTAGEIQVGVTGIGLLGSVAYLEVTTNVIMTGLPTVDPEVVGAVWNDAGVLKVSAG